MHCIVNFPDTNTVSTVPYQSLVLQFSNCKCQFGYSTNLKEDTRLQTTIWQSNVTMIIGCISFSLGIRKKFTKQPNPEWLVSEEAVLYLKDQKISKWTNTCAFGLPYSLVENFDCPCHTFGDTFSFWGGMVSLSSTHTRGGGHKRSETCGP